MNEHSRKVVHSSETQNYGTPGDFFAWLQAAFAMQVDACAERWNAKLPRYWTVVDDGMRQPWDGLSVFYNPQYDQTRWWVDKARDQAERFGTLSVGLLAARTGSNSQRRGGTGFWDRVMAGAGPLKTSYFHERTRVLWLVWKRMVTGVYFHDERLEFEHNERDTIQAPFDSAVVIFAPAIGQPRPKSPPAAVLAKLVKRMDAGGLAYSSRPLLSDGQPWGNAPTISTNGRTPEQYERPGGSAGVSFSFPPRRAPPLSAARGRRGR